MKPDVSEACSTAKDKVLAGLQTDLEAQALSRALAEVQFRLNGFGPKIGKLDAAMLEQEMQHYLRGIDVQAAVKKARDLLSDVLANRDYDAALRFYNSKVIPAVVAQALGIPKATYVQIVLGVIKEEPNGPVANAMRKAVA
jgi:hypothetical protein